MRKTMKKDYSQKISVAYLPPGYPKVTQLRDRYGYIRYPSETQWATILRERHDSRSVQELVRERIKTQAKDIQILNEAVTELVATTYNVVHIRAWRIMSKDGTKIEKQQLQYTRKPFDVAQTASTPYGYQHWLKTDTNQYIYGFDHRLNNLDIIYEGVRTRRHTLDTYIQVPENGNIKTAVDQAVSEAFDKYCEELMQLVATFKSNTHNWERKNG